jgi:nucleoside-diphosphate-sugar epimerase
MTERSPSTPRHVVLVTGSSGHLGEALMRVLPQHGYQVRGIDVAASPSTTAVGSVTDRDFVRRCLEGVTAVIHTATLHKPHVATHSRQAFVDTNITGTLNLLEEAVDADVRVFVFTSTTSVYGGLMAERERATSWITEASAPRPKNVYGLTKVAAEEFCELFHRKFRLPCLVLRTSRFFQDPDDNPTVRRTYSDDNSKVNEFLYRRVDLEDVVSAHLRALELAPDVGFGRYIISATSPLQYTDLGQLAVDAPAVVERYVPGFREAYRRLGWSMFPTLDRVYVNDRARHDLQWQPRFDFAHVLALAADGRDYRSELARMVGMKGYHAGMFTDGRYPVD